MRFITSLFAISFFLFFLPSTVVSQDLTFGDRENDERVIDALSESCEALHSGRLEQQLLSDLYHRLSEYSASNSEAAGAGPCKPRSQGEVCFVSSGRNGGKGPVSGICRPAMFGGDEAGIAEAKAFVESTPGLTEEERAEALEYINSLEDGQRDSIIVKFCG